MNFRLARPHFWVPRFEAAVPCKFIDGQFSPGQRLQLQSGDLVPGVSNTPLTFTFVDSSTSTSNIIVIPALAAAGDIGVFFDMNSNAGGIPTDVLPAGWNDLGSAGNSAAASGRFAARWKELVGGDPGANVTGINGAQTAKVMLVFRPSRPIVSTTASTWDVVVDNGDPAAQTILASGQVAPLIAMAGVGKRSATAAYNTESPLFSAQVAITQCLASYTVYNSAPANHTVDTDGSGTQNGLASGYLRFT
jgi:hypothetical protein